jgi:hypothetical protein
MARQVDVLKFIAEQELQTMVLSLGSAGLRVGMLESGTFV